MVEMWSKKGNSNFTADDLPTVSEFLLQGWSKNAKWKCFRVAEQLQLRERRAQVAMRVPSICQSICPSFPTHPSIHPPTNVLLCHVHKFAAISIPQVMWKTFKERCWY